MVQANRNMTSLYKTKKGKDSKSGPVVSTVLFQFFRLIARGIQIYVGGLETELA